MNIYALSSGPGISGVAVIRVSGKNTKDIIIKLSQSNLPTPRVATLKKLYKYNSDELIDECIILWFPGPNSYTGEDMAEFHVHGSRAVVDAIQTSISKLEDCRLAEPGEFTKIAFQNGKIDLMKAEGISDLISSETEIQRKQAIKTMEGKSSKLYENLRNVLIKVLSKIEAKIDFPDEDLPTEILDGIKADTAKALSDLEKILDDQRVGERIREGFKISIIGPTNVGKSSLLNHLANREVAIVSEIAGTTRDVIETHLNLDGYPVIISDTAGIRDSKDEIERKGIKLSLKNANEADLNIIVLEPKSVDFQSFLSALSQDKNIIVVNKLDNINDKINEEIKKLNPISISVKENKNIDLLINKIKKKLQNKFISSNDIIITRSRHRDNIEKCINHLKNFQDKNSEEEFDKAAEDLRLAVRHLGLIVGKVDVEEILGSIFNDFCIGK
ncbi:MAG: tRNA uridine-5-carboxymethylaminomethyl(34) synthesis GTPase MnmE [Candidatus Pelagibacter sp.]